ncbi:cytochrome c [Microaerobacter geothermalis]|uniref:c-type cytochrome n=1 Tax=Microaerobacter geothermalis TaxID=674972 RepID=UPI001F375456|nr:cytochrome c [Microaerobacter geothermalis]MCF6092600.1 cytochrome c [Microaerobacter geothermalis]
MTDKEHNIGNEIEKKVLTQPKNEKKEYYDEVSGIRMGNAKVPKFLMFVYVTLAIWGVVYALTAKPLNDRLEATQDPKSINGEQIVKQTCLGCHNLTAEMKVGPGLKGVSTRLTEDQLNDVLDNGRGAMPALPTLGLNTEQINAVKGFLKGL